jgi:hypothetical protein
MRGARVTLAVVLAALGLAVAAADGPARAPGVVGAIVVVGAFPHQSVATVATGGGAGRVVARYSVPGIRSLAWSPDRRHVAVVTAGSSTTNAVELLNLATGTTRRLADARRRSPAAFFGTAAWVPTGDVLAVTRSRSLFGARIELLDARTGRVRKSFRVFARLDSGLSWTSTGRGVVFAEQRDAGQRPRLRLLVVGSGHVEDLGYSSGLDPAVRRGAVAFAAADGIRVGVGGHESLLRGSRRADRAPSWSSSGKSLLLERPTGNCPRSFTPQPCTHVLVVSAATGAARPLLSVPARAPVSR